MGKFWDGVGGKLAERWAAVSLPALVFWLGGALAWAWSRGGWQALRTPADWLGRQPGGVQAMVLLVALLGVAASGMIVDRLTGRALAVLEGYWPGWLARRRTASTRRRAERDEREFQRLTAMLADGTADPEQRLAYVRLGRRMRRRPALDRLLPTYVGNVLRAAETRPLDKYGLDAVAVWPHLWLLLPESVRTELAAARRSLDGAVAAAVWGLLFLAFTPFAWWVPPVALAVAAGTVLAWVPARAEVFADLLEAAFDLHRTALYTQLRWPLPVNPADERTTGRRVTTYLIRGLGGTTPTFTGDQATAAGPAATATRPAAPAAPGTSSGGSPTAGADPPGSAPAAGGGTVAPPPEGAPADPPGPGNQAPAT